MKVIKKDFTCNNAETSRKPGYLKARFDIIRRQQKEDAEKLADETRRVVKPIKVAAK